jgi:hypothetical protein
MNDSKWILIYKKWNYNDEIMYTTMVGWYKYMGNFFWRTYIRTMKINEIRMKSKAILFFSIWSWMNNWIKEWMECFLWVTRCENFLKTEFVCTWSSSVTGWYFGQLFRFIDVEFCFEGVRYVLSPMDDFEKRIKKNCAIGNHKSE